MTEEFKPKITKTVTKTFEKGIIVTVEISDTDRAFCYRLRCGEAKTNWVSYYEGVLILEVSFYEPSKGLSKRIFAYATAYWEGTLPIEEPFEIVKGS